MAAPGLLSRTTTTNQTSISTPPLHSPHSKCTAATAILIPDTVTTSGISSVARLAFSTPLFRPTPPAIRDFLGAGHPVCVPHCVINFTKDIFPDPDGAYMGHKDGPAMGDGD